MKRRIEEERGLKEGREMVMGEERRERDKQRKGRRGLREVCICM